MANTFTGSGPKLTKKKLLQLESQLGSTLPDDYYKFLSETNGGRPEKSFFQHAREPYPSYVNFFCTVDDNMALPSRDSHYMSLAAANYARKSLVPAHMLIVGLVDDEDPLLLSISGKTKGKVFLKHMGSMDKAPREELEQAPSKGVIRLASSFSDFLACLYESSEE